MTTADGAHEGLQLPPLVLPSYRETIAARVVRLTTAAAPPVGRFLRRAGRRMRAAVFQVGGLGCIVAAAWYVAIPLGLFAAGVALLLLEPLTAPEPEP